MATLNVNIPRFYCLLRKEFLYDGQAHHGEFVTAGYFYDEVSNPDQPKKPSQVRLYVKGLKS